ncbi:hypothetical protein [Vibrio sp. CAU 1672]|uniref:hypothetical protein n=1 Tax=Vibrio sp. CAU 1672 TaxID=3032594 RepID=UPI0023DAC17A|nr:hypothetical protein [Vibrio sp. CAU 1672]MDF2153045.1 hypothetical protein [Vibrio sp. CAU 1672]
MEKPNKLKPCKQIRSRSHFIFCVKNQQIKQHAQNEKHFPLFDLANTSEQKAHRALAELAKSKYDENDR